MTEQTIADIRDSRTRGTNKGLTQHPHIDPLQCIGCGSCIAACPESGVIGLVDGIAHVIHASRCVGHSHCEIACPVGALKVGLGDLSTRTDIPVLSDDLETSVPGLFIAGELSGIALIRNAVEDGVKAVEAIARRVSGLSNRFDGMVDVLIVGAGPAGIAASLKAIECNLTYATISQDDAGGSVRKYPRRKLAMTQPMQLPLHGYLKKTQYVKEELVAIWDEVIETHGVKIQTGVGLTTVEHRGHYFVSQTTAGPVESRFVLLALGRRGTPRKLNVPGEESEKVLYQLVDAATYMGQRILVVGGGDSAVETAMALAEQSGNEVVLSYRKSGFFRLKPRNEERIGRYLADGRIKAYFSSGVGRIEADQVNLVIDADSEPQEINLPNDYVFVLAGGEPPYPLLRSCGIRFHGETPHENSASELLKAV
ncbi:MAG: NAD(P)-binding domain-containing protein [Kiritimatiellales bacterium]|nr:NAD(P)-binding domain-containing protein [Kiritimatiellales bacterium]